MGYHSASWDTTASAPWSSTVHHGVPHGKPQCIMQYDNTTVHHGILHGTVHYDGIVLHSNILQKHIWAFFFFNVITCIIHIAIHYIKQFHQLGQEKYILWFWSDARVVWEDRIRLFLYSTYQKSATRVRCVAAGTTLPRQLRYLLWTRTIEDLFPDRSIQENATW